MAAAAQRRRSAPAGERAAAAAAAARSSTQRRAPARTHSSASEAGRPDAIYVTVHGQLSRDRGVGRHGGWPGTVSRTNRTAVRDTRNKPAMRKWRSDERQRRFLGTCPPISRTRQETERPTAPVRAGKSERTRPPAARSTTAAHHGPLRPTTGPRHGPPEPPAAPGPVLPPRRAVQCRVPRSWPCPLNTQPGSSPPSTPSPQGWLRLPNRTR